MENKKILVDLARTSDSRYAMMVRPQLEILHGPNRTIEFMENYSDWVILDWTFVTFESYGKWNTL